MKYYAVFLGMKDEEKSKTYRQEHIDFITKMADEGNIEMFGRFVDGIGGLVIYKGESLEQIEALANKDPYVIKGARNLEVHEWEVKFVK